MDRTAAVLRVLGGEDLIAVASELDIAADVLTAWRDNFVLAGSEALTAPPTKGPVLQRVVSLNDVISEGPHPRLFVWWDSITEDDVWAFQVALNTARREEDVQAYLAAHPLMLVQPLGGGHGRWVRPKTRLGSEHVTDFVIGDKDSTGYSWIAVELESPLASLFTRTGDETQALRHAIRQIEDWRVWLGQNHPYARSRQVDGGLELLDVSPNLHAWVIIGRRSSIPPEFNSRRRLWRDNHGIEVHTYDWLIDRANDRLRSLLQHRTATYQGVSPP